MEQQLFCVTCPICGKEICAYTERGALALLEEHIKAVHDGVPTEITLPLIAGVALAVVDAVLIIYAVATQLYKR